MFRLLLLCEFPTLLGGERSMLATLSHVRDAGYDVIVAAPAVGPLRDALDELGVAYSPFDVRDSRGVRRSLEEIRAELRTIIKKFQPDIVHANSLSMGRISGPVVQGLGVPSIAHLRDIMRLSRPAIADLNCHTCRITVSRETLNFHLAQGLKREYTLVMHNGVDVDVFQPRDTQTNRRAAGVSRMVPDGSPLVTTVGQLGMRKGVDLVLEAAKYVATRHLAVHFFLVGDRTSSKDEAREYERRLHETVAVPPLAGRVHFLGIRDDVPDILNDSAILVHAARQEPLGRVLLEAAASGVPIVATRVGGTAEIFPDICEAALLVGANTLDNATARQLADNILRVLNDERLAKRLGANARRRAVACFSSERAARKLLRVYARVAGVEGGGV